MKKGQQVKEKINEKEYTFQFNGLRAADRAIKAVTDGKGEIDIEKMRDYLFENVVVEPAHIDYDEYFESADELDEVTKIATEVMRGKFREDKKDKGANKK